MNTLLNLNITQDLTTDLDAKNPKHLVEKLLEKLSTPEFSSLSCTKSRKSSRKSRRQKNLNKDLPTARTTRINLLNHRRRKRSFVNKRGTKRGHIQPKVGSKMMNKKVSIPLDFSKNNHSSARQLRMRQQSKEKLDITDINTSRMLTKGLDGTQSTLASHLGVKKNSVLTQSARRRTQNYKVVKNETLDNTKSSIFDTPGKMMNPNSPTGNLKQNYFKIEIQDEVSDIKKSSLPSVPNQFLNKFCRNTSLRKRMQGDSHKSFTTALNAFQRHNKKLELRMSIVGEDTERVHREYNRSSTNTNRKTASALTPANDSQAKHIDGDNKKEDTSDEDNSSSEGLSSISEVSLTKRKTKHEIKETEKLIKSFQERKSLKQKKKEFSQTRNYKLYSNKAGFTQIQRFSKENARKLENIKLKDVPKFSLNSFLLKYCDKLSLNGHKYIQKKRKKLRFFLKTQAEVDHFEYTKAQNSNGAGSYDVYQMYEELKDSQSLYPRQSSFYKIKAKPKVESYLLQEDVCEAYRRNIKK
ncbi:unnamed protein product [Moneuplotes crassus]|uniref:Uncharacterized protein n=1 Tax=Euplotes crassus TaxID=5936 RepID=A0AAD1U729_EUPCR|nr:unnamed protein product [Moneuplotes crassus]